MAQVNIYSRERAGLGVESLTPKREVGFRYLPQPCCVLKQRCIYSLKSTGNIQKAVALADMKEIVDWDVKHLNTKKKAFQTF